MAFGKGGCAVGVGVCVESIVKRRITFGLYYPSRCSISPLFLPFCRFSSSSGARGSVTLVRGGILGREDARGSAVLCPRALPGYLL